MVQVSYQMLDYVLRVFLPDKEVTKELVKVQELIKANIQRSKVIQDQVRRSFDIHGDKKYLNCF